MKICPYALSLQRVPSKKWTTRAELLQRLELAKAMLEQTHDLDHSIRDLAEIAAISPSHFCRLFRETYGQTPQRYRAGVRLDRAHVLLRDTAMPIGDVMREVGYVSPPTFTRQFRARFGQSPRAVRRGYIEPTTCATTPTPSLP